VGAIVPDRLKTAARARQLVPFVGSGISRKSAPHKFPDWVGLLKLLLEYSLKNKYVTSREARQIEDIINAGKLLMAAEVIKGNLPEDEYIHQLRHLFTYNDADNINLLTQKKIIQLNPRIIITTNYDRLIEDAYSSLFGKAPNVATYRDTSNLLATIQEHSLSTGPVIFKAHGDVGSIDSMILSDRDYKRIMFDEAMYDNLMSSMFLNSIMLFVGFSLSDREIIAHIEKLRHRFNYGTAPHFALLAIGSVNRLEAISYRKEFGIEIIEYNKSHNHRGLDDFLDELAGFI